MQNNRLWELARFISIDTSANRYKTYSIHIARPSLFNNNFTVIYWLGKNKQESKKKGTSIYYRK